MNVLWLVVARAGSQGLPQKNISLLGGLPLLAWRICSALGLQGDVWLSTDSPEYAELGKNFGAKIPFLRPAELATSTASSAEVCLHAMEYAIVQGRSFDAVALLQPTSPFVSRDSLLRAVAMLQADTAAHGVVAVRKAHPGSALMQPLAPTLDVLAARLGMCFDIRRQAAPEEITPCGGFFIARWEKFLQNPLFYAPHTLPMVLEGVETLDIDTALDLDFAAFCVQSGRVHCPYRIRTPLE